MALGVISSVQLSVPERKEKKPVLDKYVFELPNFIKYFFKFSTYCLSVDLTDK